MISCSETCPRSNHILFRILLMLLPFIWPFASKAQEARTFNTKQADLRDSLLHKKLRHDLEKIRNWEGGEKDSLERLLLKTLDMSKLLNNHNATSEILFFLGLFSKKEGLYETAQRYYLEAIPYTFRSRVFADRLPRIYCNLGDISMSLGNYPLAASYFYAALNLLPHPLHNNDIALIVYSGIAGIHMRHGHYQKSLKYIRQSLAIARRLDHRSLPQILGNTANIYALLHLTDSAAALQREGLLIARRKKDTKSEQGLLISVGELYFQNRDYEHALPYFQQAIAINEQHPSGNTHMNAYLQYITGHTYNHLKKYTTALPFLLRSLALSESSNLKDYVPQLYAALAGNYGSRKDYRTAWEYERRYASLKDTLMNKERTSVIQGLEFQYQTIQKDMELTRKELVISQQQHAINTRNTLSAIAISAMIIITLLSFTFYKNTKNKQQMQADKLRTAQQEQDILKQREAINVMQALMEGEEKERRRISQELHDGIGGRLAALQMYCSSEEIAARLGAIHFAEINGMLESTAEEIRDTAHNLMPDVLSRYSFSDAIETHCRQISAHNTLDITLQIHAMPEVLPPSTQLSLYRAIQEVLQNIIKHAHATQVNLQINRTGDVLIVIIEDNGAGFRPEPEQGYQGMGLANIRNRIKSLNGHLLIESSPGKGSIIQIEIPVTAEKHPV